MDYLALRIPSDMKQKMTASTWTGTPPLQGSNGIYEQTGCELVDIVPAMYYDAKWKLELNGDLYVDDEGLIKGRLKNWRASQLRHWFFSKIQDQLEPNWRDYTYIAGDAVFVVRGTEENMKIMEDILDS